MYIVYTLCCIHEHKFKTVLFKLNTCFLIDSIIKYLENVGDVRDILRCCSLRIIPNVLNEDLDLGKKKYFFFFHI